MGMGIVTSYNYILHITYYNYTLHITFAVVNPLNEIYLFNAAHCTLCKVCSKFEQRLKVKTLILPILTMGVLTYNPMLILARLNSPQPSNPSCLAGDERV